MKEHYFVQLEMLIMLKRINRNVMRLFVGLEVCSLTILIGMRQVWPHMKVGVILDSVWHTGEFPRLGHCFGM